MSHDGTESSTSESHGPLSSRTRTTRRGRRRGPCRTTGRSHHPTQKMVTPYSRDQLLTVPARRPGCREIVTAVEPFPRTLPGDVPRRPHRCRGAAWSPRGLAQACAGPVDCASHVLREGGGSNHRAALRSPSRAATEGAVSPQCGATTPLSRIRSGSPRPGRQRVVVPSERPPRDGRAYRTGTRMRRLLVVQTGGASSKSSRADIKPGSSS